MNNLADRIAAALAHTLNGDPGAAWDEGLCVQSARLADGRIVVEFSQDDSNTRIRAALEVCEIGMTAKVKTPE